MPYSALCTNLNYTNFSLVGRCFVEQVFMGDVVLFSILLTIMFVFLVVRYNFPKQLLFPFGSVLFYTLYLTSGSEIFLSLLILTAIITGAVMVIGLMNYLNR